MWQVESRFTFEASHQLPSHDGKCRRIHGHSWVMVVTISGSALREDRPKSGMLMDYGDIKSLLSPIIDNYLDHQHLNETTGLKNPTSEALAEWIYNRVAPVLERIYRGVVNDRYSDTIQRIRLVSVRIEETCTSAATYFPDITENTTPTKANSKRTKALLP